MISTDIRNLKASMKAHYECGQLSQGFFSAFMARLDDLAERAENMEKSSVAPHARRSSVQLELIEGGRS
ncbi:hypothetical protein ACSHT0_06675 [Tepidicaulis sp. LMO-SS28]|uniref:hypothetical protein n=1 Tax=Tepidicaulis sp. LMO-SS28 TaxID=3447455 RepID=UPI003EDF26A3